MPKFKVKTRGGRKLRDYVKEKRKQVAKLKGTVLSVGFHDPKISALAKVHEFGLRAPDGSQKLPQRPAFRNGLKAARRDWRAATRAAGKALSSPRRTGDEAGAALRAGAVAVRDTIKESYSSFHGVPLSPRQEARKKDTPGEGRQLVGHRGPKLIEHIEAREAGRGKVDD